jgi:hypothetical protein
MMARILATLELVINPLALIAGGLYVGMAIVSFARGESEHGIALLAMAGILVSVRGFSRSVVAWLDRLRADSTDDD